MTAKQCFPMSGRPLTWLTDVTVKGKLLSTAEPLLKAKPRDLFKSSSLYFAFVSRISNAFCSEKGKFG